MRRRLFLSALGAVAVAAASFAPVAASAKAMIDYKPGAVKRALASGKSVLLAYSAKWCPNCRAQMRTVQGLRSQNSAYDKNIVFIRVDWDDYGSAAIARNRRVGSRTTLVLLSPKGKETGRVVGSTRKSRIKGLLDKAL